MYGHVITKFSRMGSLPHSFTHGAPLRASRARAPLKINRWNHLKSFVYQVVNVALAWDQAP